MRPRRRRALPHRGDEIGLAPSADAVSRMRRDVGRIEGAERRLQGKAAAEPGLVLLVRNGMTGRAAAGIEHGLAVSEVGRARGERVGGKRRRRGDEPERRGGDDRRRHCQDHELAQHRRPFKGEGRPARCRWPPLG